MQVSLSLHHHHQTKIIAGYNVENMDSNRAIFWLGVEVGDLTFTKSSYSKSWFQVSNHDFQVSDHDSYLKSWFLGFWSWFSCFRSWIIFKIMIFKFLIMIFLFKIMIFRFQNLNYNFQISDHPLAAAETLHEISFSAHFGNITDEVSIKLL